MSTFLDNQFSKESNSAKGLALAIDHFLGDNLLIGFTADDLGERFGVTPKQIRSAQRDHNKLGTRKNGNLYAQSSNPDVMLYVLKSNGSDSHNQYVASNWQIDPRTGNQYPVNPRDGKPWKEVTKSKAKK